jgi:hypothetical protein
MLCLRVLFPDNLVERLTVCPSDTPRGVALAGPALKEPVVLVHMGRCLCPYLSLASQGVRDGDLIVLHTIIQTVGPSAPPKDDVFSEVLRLADAVFGPYEASPFGGLAYQQMLVEEEQPWTEDVPTIIAESSQAVSTEELPICWADAEEVAGTGLMAQTVRDQRVDIGGGQLLP